MKASSRADFVAIERERIQLEYQRREREVSSDLYAPWQPSAQFLVESRNRAAAVMLHRLGVFPKPGAQCLEVGFGALGWLSELISWGVREADLHGIELDPSRARKAGQVLPVADLRTGDAVELPWDDGTFQLAISSTLFTSILDQNVRCLIADEIVRVLAPGGALLWYDFAYNNPANPNVRGIDRAELKRLFPNLQGKIRTVTLAPPLTRRIAPRWWTLAVFLEAIPLLRTHLIAVLIKNRA
jgi:ubiquinone/menaquinone biosynthesis C-methylase UbiE